MMGASLKYEENSLREGRGSKRDGGRRRREGEEGRGREKGGGMNGEEGTEEGRKNTT